MLQLFVYTLSGAVIGLLAAKACVKDQAVHALMIALGKQAIDIIKAQTVDIFRNAYAEITVKNA